MKPGTLWPIGISAVLAATVAANVALYRVAGGDPSVVIEPNYYAKAVAWDSTLAQVKRNDVLGWRLAPSLGTASLRGGARLSVTLTDSLGTPVTGAVVKVSALYNARAGTVLESTLAADGGGYSTQLGVDHSGQWELRFDVTRAADHFTTTARVDAVVGGPRS